jgi:hypothetical protein
MSAAPTWSSFIKPPDVTVATAVLDDDHVACVVTS